MISAWTSHLETEEEKQRFKNQVLGSKAVLDRLAQLLAQREKDMEVIELNTTVYDRPNWDYRQAHNNGFKACLKSITVLLTTLDQKENKNGGEPIRPE